MPDNSTLAARLDEAEAALHDLTIGRREESYTRAAGDVSRTVKWTAASIPDLRAYIAGLRRQLGMGSRRRAIGLSFR